MTKEEAIEKMRECIQECEGGDYQEPHQKADNVLCALLISLGYKDLVDLYNEVDKWYS